MAPSQRFPSRRRSECIIITELARGAITQYRRRMYIALSRATVGVTIVCTPEAVEADPILALAMNSA